MYENSKQRLPDQNPHGINKSKELKVEKPKELMMIGRKVEIGPLEIMIKKLLQNNIQKFPSRSSSVTCAILK